MTDQRSLLKLHDVLLVDLDGTLYAGHDAIPHAVDAVVDAAARGVRTAYVTNNASRRPSEVAAHLGELGFPATTDDVMTSSQAGAALLAEQVDPGAAVLVLGTDALAEECALVGLKPVREAPGAVAVIQGHNPDTGWRNLAEASVVLRAGGIWVATNTDLTLPTPRGPLPGNGAMVTALKVATGLEPQVAGKPGLRLVREAVERSGARAGLVVGDRLDTDIEGGHAASLPTLLVLTGISGPSDVLAAVPQQRPAYVAANLTALPRPAVELATDAVRPGWYVEAAPDGGVLLAGDGDGSPEPGLDALRSLCAVHWARGGGPYTLRTDGDAAAGVATELGLVTRDAQDVGAATGA
ncbi:HAD-superfamily hydrolase, subfamily IIA [Pseudonocardia dioxanivorans CB1190]|uniref:HAD-superfamily hydrolase, subfamily IIA n=1 Tax=Pseudonocardia dioxanivorans (strain ATCC 55486 / DSM 44775 / JCM 13855 / CB1190) TaxID=675635 RepID=F4CLF0_PSEUX|nr:HAD hydrolase-like protein [Pseudonocardia dioxanivorans]AEA25992.1 HAD-superfamily hydrolase, subfamily IIA [Pseudonocardia dioxanivorans CB1190]